MTLAWPLRFHFALVVLVAWHISAEEQITVDVQQVERIVEPRVLGINTNFIMDGAALRSGRGLKAALQTLGVRALRYPGGDKSDAFLWSVPPFNKPQTTLARTGPDEWPSADTKLVKADQETLIQPPLDFDCFMKLCRELKAEPVLVVCFDSMYKPASRGGSAPTHEQLLHTAVEWVRYANVTKKYGVRYWEIGNESYLDSYNGGARAEDYARDLVAFAKAMKAVDPSIRIGANGPDSANATGKLDEKTGDKKPWWQTVLAAAGPEIDFLAIHIYPCWKWMDYDGYRTRTPNLLAAIDQAAVALQQWAAPEDARRIRFAVTEYNAYDWFGFPKDAGWPNVNDLGHALVVFEMTGEMLKHPRVDLALLWNTRWVDNATNPKLGDTFDKDNELLPTGRALAIWRQFLGAEMVHIEGTPSLRTFASYNREKKALSVFVLNKERSAQGVRLVLKNYAAEGKIERWVFSGNGPEDKHPTWRRIERQSFRDGAVQVELDPVSVTVLALQG